MFEVLSSNFDEILPRFKCSLQNAAFVALDTEFTGLVGNPDKKSSLFDNAEQRYLKLRDNAVLSRYIISQVGMTIFSKDLERENSFEAECYTFYLCPRSFGSLDRRFSFQSSSLDFLRNNHFNFEKFLTHGLSYLNEEEEKQILSELESKSYLYNVERDVDEWYLQEMCSTVSEWLCQAQNDDELTLGHLFSQYDLGIQKYSLINELRTRFSSVWATSPMPEVILVRKVSASKRAELEHEAEDENATLYKTLMGFSLIFKELVECKKPIVGHNMFTDLILIHHQFFRPLPKSYSIFKKSVTSLFGVIFDTKHISSEVQRLGGKRNRNLATCLSLVDLYKHYSEAITISSPNVYVKDNVEIETKAHNAGFDSYACGYVFIQLAHALARSDLSIHDQHFITWTELLVALEPYQHKVNLIRGSVHHVNLTSADQKSQRPPSLFVQMQMDRVNIMQLTKMFSNFGRVDITPCNETSALVAVPNIGCAKDILREFKYNPDFKVSIYNPFKHSPYVRMAMLSSCLGFLTLGTFCVYKLS